MTQTGVDPESRTCGKCHRRLPEGALECSCDNRLIPAPEQPAGAGAPAIADAGALAPRDSAASMPSEENDVSRRIEIERLLSAANLERVRKNWDAAASLCADVLRLDPVNPAAYSLLGNLHARCGRREEAIQWLEMALEIQPDAAADRALLDRLKGRKRSSWRSWDLRIRGPADASGWWIRIGVPVAFLLTLLSMGFGALAFLTSHPPAGEKPGNGVPPGMEIPEALRPGPRRPGAAVRSPAAISTLPIEKIESAEEASLHDLLGRRIKGSPALSVLYVQMSPGGDEALVSLQYGTESGRIEPGFLIDAAYAVAAWAFHERPALERIVTRLLHAPGRRGTTRVALEARTDRVAMAASTPATTEEKARSFRRLSWDSFFFPRPPYEARRAPGMPDAIPSRSRDESRADVHSSVSPPMTPSKQSLEPSPGNRAAGASPASGDAPDGSAPDTEAPPREAITPSGSRSLHPHDRPVSEEASGAAPAGAGSPLS